MTLVDTENNSAGEDYFPPLERFQTCSSQPQYEQCLSEDMLSYFHSFIPDAELQESILKYNLILSNVLPLDEFFSGVLEEIYKYWQMQQDKLLKKMQRNVLLFQVLCRNFARKLKGLLSVKLIGLKQTCANLKNFLGNLLRCFGKCLITQHIIDVHLLLKF